MTTLVKTASPWTLRVRAPLVSVWEVKRLDTQLPKEKAVVVQLPDRGRASQVPTRSGVDRKDSSFGGEPLPVNKPFLSLAA